MKSIRRNKFNTKFIFGFIIIRMIFFYRWMENRWEMRTHIKRFSRDLSENIFNVKCWSISRASVDLKYKQNLIKKSWYEKNNEMDMYLHI